MRISDITLSTDYINNLNTAKSKVENLQNEIATGNKIQQPSDSPGGTSNIIQWNTQLQQMNTYSSNIDNGSSFVQDTTNTMQNIQSEVTNVLNDLTSANNIGNSTNLNNFADQINQSLQSIINLANTQSDGKYIFGGTDFSAAPYAMNSSNTAVTVQVGDVSGAQKITTSNNIQQQINMTGTEVFGTIVTQNGTIDSGTAVGGTVSSQTNVYDAQGNQYTFKVNYTKTAADTYSMTYDVLDSSNNSVLSAPPAAETMVFNSSTGKLQTINNQTPAPIHVKVGSKNIDFSFDPTSVSEASGSTSLSFSANQQTDIFNTLLSIVNQLKSGKTPDASLVQSVTNFNNRLTNNISKAGNIENQLTNTKNLLTSQQTQLQTMISNEQGVDVAQSVMDLQNQETLLQMIYKMAGMVSTQSLLNYI